MPKWRMRVDGIDLDWFSIGGPVGYRRRGGLVRVDALIETKEGNGAVGLSHAETASPHPSATSFGQVAAWRMQSAPTVQATYPLWSWLNITSCDAPLIALLWQACFAISFDVTLSWYQPLCLTLATWCVYASDRWYDGVRLNPRLPHAARHRFHRQFRTIIAVGVILAMLLCAGLVAGWMRTTERQVGVGLAMLTGLHCSSRRLFGTGCVWMKEITVGGVFAVAVSHAVALRAFDSGIVVATILSGALFTANCLLIGSIERPLDAAQRFNSSEQRFGNLAMPVSVLLAGVGVFSLAALAAGIVPRFIALATALGALGLVGVQHWTHHLPRDARTVLAEAVLFSPVLAWWLHDG